MQAVIFDLDGVLIDSEHLWDEVRRDIALTADRPWPAGATQAMQGVSTADWSQYMATTIGIPGTPEVIAEMVTDSLAARYRSKLPLMAGAIEAVERLATRWPLGLASASPRLLIDIVLASSRLGGLCEVAAATEEVAAGKPAPDVYNEVVRRLGADPAQTVAVEDSSNGLRAAGAAHLIVVAIPQPGFPPAADALALATARAGALDELTTDFIDRLMAGGR